MAKRKRVIVIDVLSHIFKFLIRMKREVSSDWILVRYVVSFQESTF